MSLHPDFAKALVTVQGALEGAKKDTANPFHKTKYADLKSCWEACGPALQLAGIAVLQFPVMAAPGFVGLRTTLVHGATGEVWSEEYTLPLKEANSAQAMGSAITYARRYALCSILGICPEDDDGNAASTGGKGSGSGKQAQSYPKAQTAEVHEVGHYAAQFAGAASVDERKAVYTALKNSGVLEPEKTMVLSAMANEIKAAQAGKGTK